jgi:small-conductance mechanosensitive channel
LQCGPSTFKKASRSILNLINVLATLPDALPAEEKSVFRQIELDWHKDVVVMVRDRLPKVAIVLLLLFVFWRIIRFFVMRMERAAERPSTVIARGAQLRTMATLIRGTAYSILGFLAFIQFLHLLNYDPTPILASAGILGVGIGLGAQSLCKDIINGIFIFVEDQYNVGETVKIASLTGTVEDLTLRLTRLRDGDGTLYIIPNSQVATVSNLSRDFAVASLAISIDASADPKRVLALLKQIAEQVRSEEAFKEAYMTGPNVSGVDNINGRALTYSISAKVRIDKKDDVLRAFRNGIIETFKQEHIPLGIDPANMLLLAQQKAADPTAPPAQQPLTLA